MSIIKDLRKQKGMSQQQLAELCGVHQTAVSQWEKGRTMPDRSSLRLLAKTFGVTMEALLGEEKTEDENKIPVFSLITAAALCSKLGSNDYFALNVTDGSMSPMMFPGDTVVVCRSMDVNSGETGVFSIGNGNAIIRKIIKKDTSIMLVSENTSYEPLIFSKVECDALPVFVLGKAVELRRKL
ncbi:MAG: helix-turn-helix domain-containing protein [Clostridia bacterium]|nr:helix-turn-helix domain-containing protein [Clostridia bacterium]